MEKYISHRAYHEFVECIATALDARDPYTGGPFPEGQRYGVLFKRRLPNTNRTNKGNGENG